MDISINKIILNEFNYRTRHAHLRVPPFLQGIWEICISRIRYLESGYHGYKYTYTETTM